jgi:hypothetical protein
VTLNSVNSDESKLNLINRHTVHLSPSPVHTQQRNANITTGPDAEYENYDFFYQYLAGPIVMNRRQAIKTVGVHIATDEFSIR